MFLVLDLTGLCAYHHFIGALPSIFSFDKECPHMKAEQRKELETNTLADKMGQVVQRVKTSPRRTFAIYLALVGVLLVAIWFAWRWYATDLMTRSYQWISLYDGEQTALLQLADEKETNVGKAARLQQAWLNYWDGGIKFIAADKNGAM